MWQNDMFLTKTCKGSETAGLSTSAVTGVTPCSVYSEEEEENQRVEMQGEKDGDHQSESVTNQVQSSEKKVAQLLPWMQARVERSTAHAALGHPPACVFKRE